MTHHYPRHPSQPPFAIPHPQMPMNNVPPQGHPIHPHPPPPPPPPPPFPPAPAPAVVSVSNLPSATSLYASLLQPLSIQFLQPCTPQQIQAPSSTFGLPHLYPPLVLLTLTQAPQHLQIPLAHVVLPAPSPQALHKFFIQCEHLVPGTVGQIERTESGERCCLRDFDGNMVEVQWTGHSSGASNMYGFSGYEIPESPINLEDREFSSRWDTDHRRKRYSERHRERDVRPNKERDGDRGRKSRRDQDTSRDNGTRRKPSQKQDRWEREKGKERDRVRERGDIDRERDKVRVRERDRGGERIQERDKARERDRERDRPRKVDFDRVREKEPNPMHHVSAGMNIPNDKESRRVLQWQEEVARSISTVEINSSSEESSESDETGESEESEGEQEPYEPLMIHPNGYARSDVSYYEDRENFEPNESSDSGFRRAESDPTGRSRRKGQRITRVHYQHQTLAFRNRSPGRMGNQRHNIIDPMVASGAAGPIGYGSINPYPETLPPLPIPPDQNPFEPIPQPKEPHVYSSPDGTRARRNEYDYDIMERRNLKMKERDYEEGRRDSGISGMNFINGGDRYGRDADPLMRNHHYERSPTRGNRREKNPMPQYDTDIEEIETSRGHRHPDYRSPEWEQGREWDRERNGEKVRKPGVTHVHLKILPAAPKAQGRSHKGQEPWSRSPSRRRAERDRSLAGQRGREHALRKEKSNQHQARPRRREEESDDESQESSSERSRSLSRSSHRQSGTSSRRPHSPVLSVISQCPSTASGSTLKAELGMIAKAPSPPSALDACFRRRRSEVPYDYDGYEGGGYRYDNYRPAAASSHHFPHNYPHRPPRYGAHDRREVPPMPSVPVYDEYDEYATSVGPSDSVSSVDHRREKVRRR